MHLWAVDYAFLAFFALIAGFLDAIVGGGGLIQLPALLVRLPQTPLPVLFGTNKLAGFAGTLVAAGRYARRIRFDWRLLLPVGTGAFAFSWLGAKLLQFLDAELLKPLVLVLLVGMFVFTLFKKDLGQTHGPAPSSKRRLGYGLLLGSLVGFYDGFFGPGTGTFLVFGFVLLLGFGFLEASAYAKVVNVLTNVAALGVFVGNGQYIGQIALLMATCNIVGSILGSRLALRKGNGFVRVVFLLVMGLLLLRYAWELAVR